MAAPHRFPPADDPEVSRELRMLMAGVTVVAALLLGQRGAGPSAPPADAAGKPELRAGALRYEPGAATADQQAVQAAIAAARPEARRLVEAVDGSIEVRVGAPAGGPVGLMETTRDGYRVTLDLGLATAKYGQRGVSRLVLHELGHVVDHALVPPGLAAQLDAATPRGYDTGGTGTGSSATREERFAESFAKWATGDIGVDLYLGYAVPPPPVDWGVPLARILR